MQKIGLLGLTFDSGNMGCNALSYSFLDIIERYAQAPIEVVCFGSGKFVETLSSERILCTSHNYSFKSASSLFKLYKELRSCDTVFDFTAGDSFSDIYGIKRMLKVSIVKLLTIFSNTKLILGPQTYGPYKNIISKFLARYILKHSYYVCTRDDFSAKLVKELSGRDIDSCTDVAFGLPYNKQKIEENGNINIGINVSGLLWRGGYTGKNQFNLSMDYKKYICDILEYLTNNKQYSVFIIPHVITKDYNSIENDLTASEEVLKLFPTTIMSPVFSTPIEAKSYISAMDIFIGARMHATIAAFSSGVVTIPVSYSRKFDGLYNSLGYDYVIDALKETNDSAITKTFDYINRRDELATMQVASMTLIDDKLNKFYDKYSTLIADDTQHR